jgi:hypothetical protein
LGLYERFFFGDPSSLLFFDLIPEIKDFFDLVFTGVSEGVSLTPSEVLSFRDFTLSASKGSITSLSSTVISSTGAGSGDSKTSSPTVISSTGAGSGDSKTSSPAVISSIGADSVAGISAGLLEPRTGRLGRSEFSLIWSESARLDTYF